MSTFDRSDFKANLPGRRRVASAWNGLFLASTLVGVLALATLITTLIDSCFGAVIIENSVSLDQVSFEGLSLDQLNHDQLLAALDEAGNQDLLTAGRREVLEREGVLATRTDADLRALLVHEVLQPEVQRAWGLVETLTQGAAIQEVKDHKYPEGQLIFRSWVTPEFLGNSTSRDVLSTGIRGALIGSLLIILLAIAFALPIGIGAAVWLEEYAGPSRFQRFLQTNIYNLAGVPSIIYGMLGLAIFVRTLGPVTGGRTVLSAGLTLALLILPIIIINTQEALKAIPQSLRWSSYGVGATRWQTVWHHVLPAAADRILTGTVFGVSRALGETAPLVVVGASAVLTLDPSGLFSRFTTLPMQVYTLSQQPQEEFRHLASAAILVLLVLLLGLNSAAIYFRGRIKTSKEAS